MLKVDRDLYEPSYVQLVTIVKKQIASGELKPGDKLPSESKLCKFHNVSPMTVRRAIDILVKEGVVTTEQGRGTFVKSIKFWEATFHLQALQKLFSNDRETKIKILEASIVPADARISEKMSLNPGDKTIYLRRLIFLQNKPFIYHREYVIYDPQRPIVESEMEVIAFSGIFEGRANSSLKRSDLSIEAIILNNEEARILQTPQGSAAFLLEHTFYDFDDKPVSWGWLICPGDRFRLSTVIGGHTEKTD